MTIYLDDIASKPAHLAHGDILLLDSCSGSGRVLMPPQSYYWKEKNAPNTSDWVGVASVATTWMTARGWRVWLSTNHADIPTNLSWGGSSAIAMRAVTASGVTLWDDLPGRAFAEGTKFAVIPHPAFELQLLTKNPAKITTLIRELLIFMQPY